MKHGWSLAVLIICACGKSEVTKDTAAPASSPSVVASSVATVSAPLVLAASVSAPAPIPSTGLSTKTPPPNPSARAAASASAAPATPVAPGVGMHFDGSHFTVDIVTPPPCDQNTECKVAVRLAAKDDFHVNKDYPYKLKMDDALGADFLGTDASGKSVFSKSAGDFSFDGEKAAVMTVRFKSSQIGPIALSGTFKLSVCNASNCMLEQAQVKATVPVK